MRPQRRGDPVVDVPELGRRGHDTLPRLLRHPTRAPQHQRRRRPRHPPHAPLHPARSLGSQRPIYRRQVVAGLPPAPGQARTAASVTTASTRCLCRATRCPHTKIDSTPSAARPSTLTRVRTVVCNLVACPMVIPNDSFTSHRSPPMSKIQRQLADPEHLLAELHSDMASAPFDVPVRRHRASRAVSANRTAAYGSGPSDLGFVFLRFSRCGEPLEARRDWLPPWRGCPGRCRVRGRAAESCRGRYECRKLRPCRSSRVLVRVDESVESVFSAYGEVFDAVELKGLRPGSQRCRCSQR